MALSDFSNKQNNADTLLSENNALLANDTLNPKAISYDAKALSEGVKITAAEIIERDLRLPNEKNYLDPDDDDVKRVRENIRLLVSPIEENRDLSTRYLRKMLFKNQEEGKTALVSIINGLETKDDFNNFILFSIRDKKRCKALFESEFLQKLIEGADVPELQLSEQSLAYFRNAIIASLATKDSTIRNWVGKKVRDKIVLTNAAIYQMIAAAGNSNTQIISRLWYFVRDEGRLNSIMQSQILDQALSNAQPVSVAHQKAMEKIRQAVPGSVEFKALQENNKQWKRWNKLFNVNYYNPATVITLAIELYTHLTNWFGHWWHGKAEATANHAAIQNMFPVMDAVVAQRDKIADLNEQLAHAKAQNILHKQAFDELHDNHQRVHNEAKDLHEQKIAFKEEIKDLKGQNGAVEQQLGEQKIVFDNEIQGLKGQNTKAEEELLELQKRNQDLENSLQALKVDKAQENERLQEEKNVLDRKAQHLQEQNEVLERELNTLKATAEIVKQMHTEKSVAIGEVQLLQKEKELLENALRAHKENELKLQEHIRSDSIHIERLAIELDQAKAKINALSHSMAAHFEAMKLIHLSKDQLKNEVHSLTGEHANQLSQLQQLIKSLNNSLLQNADMLKKQQEQYVEELNALTVMNQQQTKQREEDIKVLIDEHEKLVKALSNARSEVEDMQKLILDQEQENSKLRADSSNAKQTFVEASKVLESKIESVKQYADAKLQKAGKDLEYAQFLYNMTDMWRTKRCAEQLHMQFKEEAKNQGDISFEAMPTPERNRLFGDEMNDSASDLNLTPVGPLNLSSHSQTSSDNDTLSPVGQLARLSVSSTSSNLSPNHHARGSMVPLSPAGRLNRNSTDSLDGAEHDISGQSNTLSPVGPLQHQRESIAPLTPVDQLQRHSTSSIHSDGNDFSVLSPAGNLQNDSVALTPTQQLDEHSDDSCTLTPTGQHHRTSSSDLSTTAALMSLSPNPLNGSSEGALTPVNTLNDENINILNMASPQGGLRKSTSQKRLSLLFQQAGDSSHEAALANNGQSNTSENANNNVATPLR